MSLSEWLSEPSADGAVRTDGSPSPESRAEDPDPEGVRPVIPCLVVGSRAYHRASLERKFRAATTGTIPEVMDSQRELQSMIRTRDFDVATAVRLLMTIEAFVARRGSQ